MNLKEAKFDLAVKKINGGPDLFARLSVLDTEFIKYQYDDESESRMTEVIYDRFDENPCIVTYRGHKVFLNDFIKIS